MISIWVAVGIAWLATNVGFLLGAWWASLPRTDDQPCREGDGLASNSPQSESPFGASSRQNPVDRTPSSLPAVDRPDPPVVRSTFPRRIP